MVPTRLLAPKSSMLQQAQEGSAACIEGPTAYTRGDRNTLGVRARASSHQGRDSAA
jgi:hypothetical protein